MRDSELIERFVLLSWKELVERKRSLMVVCGKSSEEGEEKKWGGGGGGKYCAGANAIVAIGQIQFGDWDYSPDDRDVIFRPSFEIMGKFA
jgi:hypothetical protein